jgi:hypothetical protein
MKDSQKAGMKSRFHREKLPKHRLVLQRQVNPS